MLSKTEKIIEEYKNGASAVFLSKKYEFKCPKSIIKILKNNNIPTRSQKQSCALAISKKFTIEEINKIIELNNNPFITITEISKILMCDPQTIKKELIKLDQYNQNKFDKYLIKIFDNIDTEDKAYWLGFLTADGSVNDKQLSLRLAEKDKWHVEKFKKFIGVNYKISKTKTNLNGKIFFGFEYRVSSKIFVASLVKHNISPRKSFVTEIPDTISQNFTKDYIRGLVDGDGGFYISNNKLNFSLISSIKMCEQVQNILIENCKVNKTKIKIVKCKNGDMAYLQYCGNKQVRRIMLFLYDKASIYLERKYSFAISMIQ